MRVKVINCNFLTDKNFFFKLKWLLHFSYNSQKNNTCGYLEVVTKALDAHYP